MSGYNALEYIFVLYIYPFDLFFFFFVLHHGVIIICTLAYLPFYFGFVFTLLKD